MKVIILAAGQGTRLRPFTDQKPKCLVEVYGKSILDYQLDVIKAVGIPENNIVILCGYKEEVLRERYKQTQIQYIYNPEYESTNMVYTLMCAKSILEQEDQVIISYGDIFYDLSVFKKILDASDPFNVIVDKGWLSYWQERFEHPLDDAESLQIDEEGNIKSIGQKVTTLEEIQAQYIGLMKFRGEALRKIIAYYDKVKELNNDNIVTNLRTYRKMYMTDLLQALIGDNEKIKAVEIERHWYEVDSAEDITIAERHIKFI